MQEDQDNERESGDVAVYAEVDQAWLMGAIESMLFVTDEPVGVLTFADMLQVDPARVQESLVCLQRELEQAERGIQLREVAGGWRLYTHPRYHELIERYVLSWDTRKLSQAALETLAVVAYCQPITRNGVASVRGVSSDSSINSLVEKGLLREAGTQDAPGNPVLYATTRTFLEKFGLRSVRRTNRIRLAAKKRLRAIPCSLRPCKKRCRRCFPMHLPQVWEQLIRSTSMSWCSMRMNRG